MVLLGANYGFQTLAGVFGSGGPNAIIVALTTRQQTNVGFLGTVL